MKRLLVAALLLSGCGIGPDTDAAARTGVAFERAVAAKDFSAACALLSPSAVESLDGDCPSALEEASLPAATGTPTAAAHGRNAQLRFDADVLFLSRFPGGWRVVAAGCEPRPEKPYDCSVDG